MSRSERLLGAVFILPFASQLVLGLYRARLSHSSIAPALVLAAIFAGVGVLFFAKRRGWAFAFLSRPAAVALIAVGVMSTPPAIALPLDRGSVPLFAFSSAALLMLADRSLRALAVPLVAFVVSVTALEYTLTSEIWSAAAMPPLFARETERRHGRRTPDHPLYVVPSSTKQSGLPHGSTA